MSTGYEAVSAFDDSSPKHTDDASSTRLTPHSDFDEEEGLELQELAREGLKRLAGEDTAGVEQDADDDDDDEAPLAGGPRRRQDSAQSFELYTPDEERAVRRKLDTRLVLFVSLLYLLSFLDRSNIGNVCHVQAKGRRGASLNDC